MEICCFTAFNTDLQKHDISKLIAIINSRLHSFKCFLLKVNIKQLQSSGWWEDETLLCICYACKKNYSFKITFCKNVNYR